VDQVFTGWIPFPSPNQQCESTEWNPNNSVVISKLMIFTARRSYAVAVLGVVILSVRPSVHSSHACFVTNPKNLPAIFLYHMKGQSF